jgi:hypothetical protein
MKRISKKIPAGGGEREREQKQRITGSLRNNSRPHRLVDLSSKFETSLHVHKDIVVRKIKKRGQTLKLQPDPVFKGGQGVTI